MKTEEKILLRSRMLFMEKGISGTQMTEIAESSGINRRTLYRYFPTKEHLVCCLQVRISRQIVDYYNRLCSHLKSPKGAPQLKECLHLIDFNKLGDLFFLQAQFDSHFSGSYPTEELQAEMVNILNPQGKGFYRIISEGQENGTIRKDIPAEAIYQYLIESYTALTNQIVLRRSHFGNSWNGDTDFFAIYIEGFLKQFSIPS